MNTKNFSDVNHEVSVTPTIIAAAAAVALGILFGLWSGSAYAQTPKSQLAQKMSQEYLGVLAEAAEVALVNSDFEKELAKNTGRGKLIDPSRLHAVFNINYSVAQMSLYGGAAVLVGAFSTKDFSTRAVIGFAGAVSTVTGAISTFDFNDPAQARENLIKPMISGYDIEAEVYKVLTGTAQLYGLEEKEVRAASVSIANSIMRDVISSSQDPESDSQVSGKHISIVDALLESKAISPERAAVVKSIVETATRFKNGKASDLNSDELLVVADALTALRAQIAQSGAGSAAQLTARIDRDLARIKLALSAK